MFILILSVFRVSLLGAADGVTMVPYVAGIRHLALDLPIAWTLFLFFSKEKLLFKYIEMVLFVALRCNQVNDKLLFFLVFAVYSSKKLRNCAVTLLAA